MESQLVQRKRRRYGSSPVARLRKSRGLTQSAAAPMLGLRQKNTLGAVETGERQASSKLMAAMAEAYGVSKATILKACTDTYESGRSMRRHRARQMKLALAAETSHA